MAANRSLAARCAEKDIFGPNYETEVMKLMEATYADHRLVRCSDGCWDLRRPADLRDWQQVLVSMGVRVVVVGAHVELIIAPTLPDVEDIGRDDPLSHLRWLADAKPDHVAYRVRHGAGFAWTPEMAKWRLDQLIEEAPSAASATALRSLRNSVWWSVGNASSLARRAYEIGGAARDVDIAALGTHVSVEVYAAQEIARRVVDIVDSLRADLPM